MDAKHCINILPLFQQRNVDLVLMF